MNDIDRLKVSASEIREKKNNYSSTKKCKRYCNSSLNIAEYRDNMKASLKDLSVDVHTWETHALDQPNWQSKITIGAVTAEKHQTAKAQRKHAISRTRVASTSTTHPCPTCGQAFSGKIGSTWIHQSYLRPTDHQTWSCGHL